MHALFYSFSCEDTPLFLVDENMAFTAVEKCGKSVPLISLHRCRGCYVSIAVYCCVVDTVIVCCPLMLL